MPAYPLGPFAKAPILLTAGWPTYLFGSRSSDIAPTQFQITAVSITSDVATITGYITAGNIPAVGSFISVQGTQTAGGEFNVTNVAITAVSISLATGEGTISFDLTESPVAQTSDAGVAIVPLPEVGEATANGSSIAVTPPFNDPNTDGARTITVTVTNSANSLTGTPVWQLQGALIDRDEQYTNLNPPVAIGATAGTNMDQFQLNMARFYRINVSGITGGTAGTIVAKIQG